MATRTERGSGAAKNDSVTVAVRGGVAERSV